MTDMDDFKDFGGAKVGAPPSGNVTRGTVLCLLLSDSRCTTTYPSVRRSKGRRDVLEPLHNSHSFNTHILKCVKMNSRGFGELYDIISINKALDDLGMLSSVTDSRKEYLQECLKDGMEKLNIDQPGPSCICWDSQKSPKSPGPSHSTTEKENTNLGGFQVLKMNSKFITSFKAGYELPCHSIKEPSSKRMYKCFSRRRRIRTHPYENTSSVPSTSDVSSSYSNGSYRLRTTSLSSGTGKKSFAFNRNGGNSNAGSGHTIVRSRSMENLTASMDEGLILSSKPRELETVSKGIQQLRMDDCT
ncbi:hypothetical protein SK128_013493 [Halocaridina rubra]|uniref:Uncharacterized protein n=1 Tax=Halocaridina rubra TaxID=373956 RepID=A0AAN8XHM9_HALRR